MPLPHLSTAQTPSHRVCLGPSNHRGSPQNAHAYIQHTHTTTTTGTSLLAPGKQTPCLMLLTFNAAMLTAPAREYPLIFTQERIQRDP